MGHSRGSRKATTGRTDLEQVIERAIAPDVFIDDRASRDFVEDLESVRSKITDLIEKDEPARAVGLLELFIAGCYEKSEEIDDSSGSFGQLVSDLFCDWIRARQAMGSDASETAAQILSWKANDDYGYCHQIERDAVKVLDRAGLDAFEGAVLAWPNGADGSAEKSTDGPTNALAEPSAGAAIAARRQKIEILKTIREARRDVAGYAALCEEEGGMEPGDCEKLAEMCLARRRPEEALVWVDRGLDLESQAEKDHAFRRFRRPSWRLPRLRRDLLKRLGRHEEAVAAAWEVYQHSPATYSYEELMRFVARGDRTTWHERAMVVLESASLSSRIELLLKTKEWQRLAELIEATPRNRLAEISHYQSEPAAEKMKKRHPLLAAKLFVAMALRILEAKKSKYYDAALENLEKARAIMQKEGRARDWEALAAEIRAEHRRKVAFMPDFERLAEGRSFREPSFAERARKRWDRGAGRERG